MSLIRVRRKRKKEWLDTKKAKGPRRLILLLIGVIVVIWYLGFRF